MRVILEDCNMFVRLSLWSLPLELEIAKSLGFSSQSLRGCDLAFPAQTIQERISVHVSVYISKYILKGVAIY